MPVATSCVRCADPDVQRLVERWLADAAIDPPRPLELVLTTPDQPWAGRDLRPYWPQAELRFHYGPPDGGVRVVWRDGQGHATCPAGSTSAAIALARSSVPDRDRWLRPFLLPVILVLLQRAGWHHIHAATARDKSGRGWLIAGNERAGKSTTTALLASSGWAVGTDDTAFLIDGSDRIEAAAWRAPIALRDGGIALLERTGGVPLQRRAKTGFSPEDLGATWLPRSPIDVVALAVVHGGPTRIDEITPAAAVRDLLSWSGLFRVEPGDAQRHLDLVARLTRQARCVRLHLGRDLADRPDRLAELVP